MREDESYSERPWQLKKEIHVGQVLTVMAIIASVFWWVSGVETRFTQLQDEDMRLEEKTAIMIEHINKEIVHLDKEMVIHQRNIEHMVRNIEVGQQKLTESLIKAR